MEKAPGRPQGQKVIRPRRGEIYLTSFDPTVGREIKKTRPALILQNDFGNRYSELTIVAAITSRISPVPHPFEVIVRPLSTNGLQVVSTVSLNQIRTIDKRRLIKRLGAVEPALMLNVNDALLISLGSIEI